jgi:RimJ/RimL family protein N-acetyltransferase
MIVIETGRLVLRRANEEDHAFIFALVNDPDWKRFISDKGVKNAEDARDYIRRALLTQYEKLGFGLYVTALKSGGTPIGLCGLIKRDSLDDVDLGFAFLSQYRGQGYAFEAAAATLAYGKNRLGLRRLVAITMPENESSIRLLEKLGFAYEKMVPAPTPGPEDKLFAINFPA